MTQLPHPPTRQTSLCATSVSYTHLDVYKRQPLTILKNLISAAVFLFTSTLHRDHDSVPYGRVGTATTL